MTLNKTYHLLRRAAHPNDAFLLLESEGELWKIAFLKLSQDPRYDVAASYIACDFLANKHRRRMLEDPRLRWLEQLLKAQIEGYPIYSEDVIHGYSLVHGNILPERIRWDSYFKSPEVREMRESADSASPAPCFGESHLQKIEPDFWAGRKRSLPPPVS